MRLNGVKEKMPVKYAVLFLLVLGIGGTVSYGNTSGHFEGIISDLSAAVSSIQVTDNQGISTNFTMNISSRLVKKGKTIQFSDLAVGDSVRVDYVGPAEVTKVTVYVPKKVKSSSSSSMSQ